MNIPLDEVIFFDVTTRTPSTSAAVDADSAPTFAVYEESTDTDIGVGGSMTKRTSLTGNYRGTFTLSAANGFEAGKWYSVIASATVGGVTDKCVVRNFRVVAAETTAGVISVVGSVSGAVGSVTGNVGGNVTGSVGSVVGAVGSVTGNVGGNVVGSVASVTAAVTVGTINANAVNASALATDAVTEIQSGLATAANLAIVAGYLDTEILAIKAVTDKLDTAMVLDGAVYQFTANALELGPSGSGGTSDWTADERTAIRTILGVPVSGTTPEVPSAGALKVIDDLLDTEIASLATAIADVPTNAELTAALGTGTWATAIPWNANWDAEVQSECTDALNAYDPPTNSEFEARTILAASYATAVEVAKVIKTGEEFTATDGTGSKDVTFTRV